MTSRRRESIGWGVVGLVLLVAFAGCASTTSGADAADPDAISAVASRAGIAPELVYTTEVDGYDLAPQSVGASAAGGIMASWFNISTGSTLTIRTESGELTETSCVAQPLGDAPDEAVTCTQEDGVWHRSGGDIHEYVAVRDGALISVSGIDAPQADLLAGAKSVRVPSESELERLFSDVTERPGEPVERGDLPENGDGAPIDPTGPGG